MIEKRTIFEMHRLQAEGFSARGVARRLRISRKTVKKYLENPDPGPKSNGKSGPQSWIATMSSLKHSWNRTRG